VSIFEGFNIQIEKNNNDAKEYEIKLKKMHIASRVMQKLVP
jgi:hypothetical protein